MDLVNESAGDFESTLKNTRANWSTAWSAAKYRPPCN